MTFLLRCSSYMDSLPPTNNMPVFPGDASTISHANKHKQNHCTGYKPIVQTREQSREIRRNYNLTYGDDSEDGNENVQQQRRELVLLISSPFREKSMGQKQQECKGNEQCR